MEESDQKTTLSGWKKAIHIAAYPFSAAVGLLYTTASIRDTIYENQRKHDGFKDIRENFYKPAMEGLMKRSGEDAKTVAYEMAPIHKAYWKKVIARMEQRGFKKLPDYWNALHINEKTEIAFTGAGVAAVALGVILTVLESGELLSRSARKKEQKSAPDNASHAAKLEQSKDNSETMENSIAL